MSSEGRSARVVRFEPFALDLQAGELHRDGLKVKLQDKPLRILELLLERPGEVVTREQLRHALWAAETFVDFEGGLNTAVNKLRAALGDAAESPRFVETVGRRGYRFIASIGSPASPDTPARPGSAARFAKRRLVVTIAVGLSLAAAAGLLAWRARSRDEAVRAAMRSLAVLPLADLSGGSEPYLADGMTEALITELGKVRALKVISRTSAMRYKGTTKALPEVARELGVDAIVEGSVLRSDGRVRVTAQLVRARSDQQLWAQDYERDLRDLLSLQRELARAIAGEVRVRMTPGEEAHLRSTRSVDTDANDAYLRGRYYFHEAVNQGRLEDWHPLMRDSFASYQEAIRRAPDDARALAGLAQAYHWQASIGFPEFFAKAKAEAQRAIALDDTVGAAHAALAYTLHNLDWDWAGAEREYKRALELEPAQGHHGYAIWLSEAGRHREALEHIQRAEELDPMTLPLKVNAGAICIQARRYDRAEKKFRLGIDLFPKATADPRLGLGIALVHQGRPAEGIAEIRKAIDLLGEGHDSTRARSVLAWALAASGQPAGARAMLPGLEALSRGAQWLHGLDVWIARVYAALGDRDRAFVLLDKAFQQRTNELLDLKSDPAFDPLRADARYRDLVWRIGFPPGDDG